jgi:hypothetical protein
LHIVQENMYVILDTGSVSPLTYDSREAQNWVPQKDVLRHLTHCAVPKVQNAGNPACNMWLPKALELKF